jgi:hypothetical protein
MDCEAEGLKPKAGKCENYFEALPDANLKLSFAKPF